MPGRTSALAKCYVVMKISNHMSKAYEMRKLCVELTNPARTR